MGAAAAACTADQEGDARRIAALRDRLESRLVAETSPGRARVNGDREHRLCGNLNVTFEGIDAEALMLALPRLAISAGSACTSEGLHVSHVLRAIGLDPGDARGTIRFGVGRPTTEAEIEEAATMVVDAVRRLRSA
jgi:cysteine desulfurase